MFLHSAPALPINHSSLATDDTDTRLQLLKLYWEVVAYYFSANAFTTLMAGTPYKYRLNRN